jgi:hypothetical protein
MTTTRGLGLAVAGVWANTKDVQMSKDPAIVLNTLNIIGKTPKCGGDGHPTTFLSMVLERTAAHHKYRR